MINTSSGTSYRVVVLAGDKKLDVPRCIQILEAKGVLFPRSGFGLVGLRTKPRDLDSEEWGALGGAA